MKKVHRMYQVNRPRNGRKNKIKTLNSFFLHENEIETTKIAFFLFISIQFPVGDLWKAY